MPITEEERLRRKRERARAWRATDAGRKRQSQLGVASTRRKKYGISPEVYDEMLKDQNGGCAICSVERSTDGRALSVDHCHATGRVRGLLCASCNLALGHLKDDVERMRSAIAYLEKA